MSSSVIAFSFCAAAFLLCAWVIWAVSDEKELRLLLALCLILSALSAWSAYSRWVGGA